MKEHSYDVCLSFAGEDREYVERVAQELVAKNIRVFYDRYEEAELWGKDLYQHLDEIYRTRATFCVIFISAAYAKKLWTKHELRSAQSRALSENSEYVLPVRFDDTAIPAMLPTRSYIDANLKTPTQLAELLTAKLIHRSTTTTQAKLSRSESKETEQATEGRGSGSKQAGKTQARRLMNLIVVPCLVIAVLGAMAFVILNFRKRTPVEPTGVNVPASSQREVNSNDKPQTLSSPSPLVTSDAKSLKTQVASPTPATFRLAGMVVDESGQALQGANASLNDLPEMPGVETASNGTFVLENIPRNLNDQVRIRISLAGYRPQTKDVIIGRSSPRIVLRKIE